MEESREELQKEYDEATVKAEQYQHEVQRLENRIRYYSEGERKKRNHRLITRGADVESVAPEVRDMSQTAFRILVEQIFSLDNSNQTPQQTVETILNVRKPV